MMHVTKQYLSVPATQLSWILITGFWASGKKTTISYGKNSSLRNSSTSDIVIRRYAVEWWSAKIGQTGQASVADNAATSSLPRQSTPRMSLTTGGHNPTFPRAPTNVGRWSSPTPSACNTWSLCSQRTWSCGNHGSGLLHYLLLEHITHITITRRPTIQNAIQKNWILPKKHNSISSKNKFNILTRYNSKTSTAASTVNLVLSQFIALIAHLCSQHICCDAVCCAGSSATADICWSIQQVTSPALYTLSMFYSFSWANVCKTVCLMLSACCPILSVCLSCL